MGEAVSEDFTHIDEKGRAHMVDIGAKEATERMARAEALVLMSKGLLSKLSQRAMPKGDPFEIARVAGIQAAKKGAELIPLCHPIPLSYVDVSIYKVDEGFRLESLVRARAETGVEMEALTAVAVAALTLYDMCKAVDKGIIIGPVRLLEKTGGKSGSWKVGELADG